MYIACNKNKKDNKIEKRVNILTNGKYEAYVRHRSFGHEQNYGTGYTTYSTMYNTKKEAEKAIREYIKKIN